MKMHANVVDCQINVVDCHDDAGICHNNEGYCHDNAVDCPDNVTACHDNIFDWHDYISQDLFPCLNETCNDDSQLGISSPESKEANVNLKGFDSINHFKEKHLKNIFIGHYNNNSVRNKFCNVFPLLVKYDIDILRIAETKLDNSFTSM